jgi:hypothetical protein
VHAIVDYVHAFLQARNLLFYLLEIFACNMFDTCAMVESPAILEVSSGRYIHQTTLGILYCTNFAD